MATCANISQKRGAKRAAAPTPPVEVLEDPLVAQEIMVVQVEAEAQGLQVELAEVLPLLVPHQFNKVIQVSKDTLL